MQKNRYQSILYFIAFVILTTLVIQVYWNFKNYQTGKQQLINEVQISLDNAVNQYYEELAKKGTIGFASKSGDLQDFLISSDFKTILKDIDSSRIQSGNTNPIDSLKTKGISIFRGKNLDTIDNFIHYYKNLDSTKTSISLTYSDTSKYFNHLNIQKEPFELLTSKIIVSFIQDEVKLPILDSLLKQELERKKITIDYGLEYKNCGFTNNCETNEYSIAKIEPKKLNESTIEKASLFTSSKSSYLPSGSQLKLFFTNTTFTILKKNLVGILLSFLLVGAVIGCLLYLLGIINQQKQLAELKNDLISNITHEFKTPIATISVALEGIQSFNKENDPEKTKKYIEMSSSQLGKLNTMVEKILETATLNSEELQLNLEEINLVDLTESIVNRSQSYTTEKNITFYSTHQNIWKNIDVFHFENALNNIIDNAIKYGGNTIDVSIKNTNPNIIIEIKDNGTLLTKAHKDKIFEKFYRVPKGNTHDIKGFGIGLFYTKTIIEKHEGTVELVLNQGLTNFKITLPNG